MNDKTNIEFGFRIMDSEISIILHKILSLIH